MRRVLKMDFPWARVREKILLIQQNLGMIDCPKTLELQRRKTFV
jgi:hypothetical protein